MNLAELIQEARLRGKALHSPYQDLWFTADELEKENAKGEFLWGRVNFELRDPGFHKPNYPHLSKRKSFIKPWMICLARRLLSITIMIGG